MSKDLDEAKKHWRTSTIAEQQARWAQDDAQAAKDAADKAEADRQDWRKRLSETAASSAVHAATGAVVGAVLGWLIWKKR